MAALQRISSPGFNSVSSVVEMAAIPELNKSAASAPSTAATFCSTATTVGFSYRE